MIYFILHSLKLGKNSQEIQYMSTVVESLSDEASELDENFNQDKLLKVRIVSLNMR